MEKRKWPWKRKSCESESSESVSSHSGRYSDEQESLKESQNDNSQSAEATISDDEMKESVKILKEKLSAALANVSAKEDLVKQHAKVAEEAVAGWEKAESEGAALKQQLEVAVQQNVSLEVKTSHLDSALKECVRQLRRARDDQEKQIVEKSNEWESMRAELEQRILDLQAEKSASTDPNTILILEALEKENELLKQELVSCCRELEVVTIERDLSTQAVETASKLQLESIKKVAMLEGECRRLQSMARKSSPLTESSREANGSELDQFKKQSTKNLAVEIDMMDDFLEMERLAALPDESTSADNPLRAELDTMIQRVADLEAEKQELQNASDATLNSLKKAESRIAEGESMLEEVQNELRAITETKESLEFQLVRQEEESRNIAANVDSLKAEIERERKLSKELTKKCRDLEIELTRIIQETELEQSMNSNNELKIKQEDLAVAADKLEECQKTIASLGRQLQSLATLEDFLIDTSNIPPELSRESSSNLGSGELWRVPYNDTSRSSSSSPSSTNHGTTARSRNSFGKFFC